jgi:hypothetical protein
MPQAGFGHGLHVGDRRVIAAVEDRAGLGAVTSVSTPRGPAPQLIQRLTNSGASGVPGRVARTSAQA